MNDFEKIIDAVKALKASDESRKEGKLPSGSYFLNKDDVVCFPRDFGDARRPYSCDGLILWAYSSGNIKIEESTFTVTEDFDRGAQPKIAFYFGKAADGEYIPISVSGVGINDREKNVERYCVYTDGGAYYIAESENLIGGLKSFVDENKNVRFDVWVKNKSAKTEKTYISAYFDLLLKRKPNEGFEDKWYRLVETTDDGFSIHVTEYLDRTTCLNHYAYVKRICDKKTYSTTSATNFKGRQHASLPSSKSLKTGVIDNPKSKTLFTEAGVEADLTPLELKAGESAAITYLLAISDSKEKCASHSGSNPQTKREYNDTFGNIPEVNLAGNPYGVSDFAFSSFVRSVMKQTEFCARSKNYAGALIGVRDIFQQLEAALIWIPEYTRKKIVEALNFIGDDGRAPRQYSYPDNPSVLPEMDLREFIDQGVWVISTVYTYLSFTGDYTILDEVCGYYKFSGNKVDFSDRRDTVLDHLIAITDFLVSAIDEETGCLRALYGDWNDALDGLGKTKDENKKFGSGVSVMATMQLYKNLGEITEIIEKCGKYAEKIENYAKVKRNIENGVEKYAIVEKDGIKKIVHGWGDKLSFKVGSFCDNDGLSRDSATSDAFFVLSGMIEKFPEMKEQIIAAYKRLDSKYGIKTFEPYFAPDNKEVGRITHLPKGTAENAATYIHATLFAIWSLFNVGEDEEAWKQIGKILPLTHNFISTTPFVMPNSYIYNEEYGFDGESMSDWFTGSGCVLVKVLFFCVFGVKANLDGLTVNPPKEIPFKEMSTEIRVKGGILHIVYKKTSVGRRKILVNGIEVKSVVLTNADVCGKTLKIEISE